MKEERKPDTRRGEAAFLFAIVLGLVIGVLIKRMKIGIMIGIALGLFIVFTGWLRTDRK